MEYPLRLPAMIRSITIRGLFGWLDYDLEFPDACLTDGVAQLYGANGSGKTTILRLVYHLLSSKPYGGHRTAVRQVPFEILRIETGDGHVVTAQRDNVDAISFVQTVVLASGESASAVLPHERERSLRKTSISISGTILNVGNDGEVVRDAQYRDMCELLSKLDTSMVSISHGRNLVGDDLRVLSSDVARRGRKTKALSSEEYFRQFDVLAENPHPEDSNLMAVLEQARDALAIEALHCRSSGTDRSDGIYQDVIRRLIGGYSDVAPSNEYHRIMDDLRALVHENRKPALDVAPLEAGPLLALLEHTPKDREIVVGSVLRPYVDGLRARFDAARALRDTVANVVETMSSMFLNKKVGFTLEEGFSIEQRGSGTPIHPASLSSGERQLLTLVCAALSCRRRRTMLLVDEPEISLNVAWQRSITRLLKTCLAPTSAIVAATHSVEVITPFRRNTVSLSPVERQLGSAAGVEDVSDA